MVFLTILFIFIGCLLIYLYYKNVYVFDQKLKRFPRPPEIPILGHALDFVFGKGYLNVFGNYMNNYGDTVLIKLGPTKRILLSSNYKIFQFLSRDTKFLKRASEYKYFHRWLGTSLLTSDGSKWKKQRRFIEPTFHVKVLENFVGVFENNAQILVKQFEKHVTETSVDIFNMVNLCTLDIICETAMQMPIKAQENAESEFVKSIRSMLNIIIGRFFSLHKMFDCIYYFTEDYKNEKKTLKTLHSITENAINNRRTHLNSTSIYQKTKRKALLDYLLEINNNINGLTLQEVRDNVNTIMFAGHETTAAAISFTLFCLANYPEVEAKVYEELCQVFGETLESNATIEDLKDLTYLEMVIKESLRLYPPGAFLPKEVSEDVVYEGIELPKGLTIFFFYYGLHRNPEYFTEPDKFIPERFQNGNTFAFLPFGNGPRSCIGQKYAMLEMKTVISRIVRNFHLSPSIPMHQMQLESHLILFSTNGIRVNFNKRKVVTRNC